MILIAQYGDEKFFVSKKFRKSRFGSTNGEIQFVYEEHCSREWVVEKEACDESEAREISKHGVSKPLFLVREQTVPTLF